MAARKRDSVAFQEEVEVGTTSYFGSRRASSAAVLAGSVGFVVESLTESLAFSAGSGALDVVCREPST